MVNHGVHKLLSSSSFMKQQTREIKYQFPDLTPVRERGREEKNFKRKRKKEKEETVTERNRKV